MLLNYVLETLKFNLALLAFPLLFLACQSEAPTEDNSVSDQEASHFNPHSPVEGVTLPSQTITIDQPQQAQSITLSGGAQLHLPANALVFENGEPVDNPVEITYRHFVKPEEVLLSGIPMTVPQSDGSEDWMETAGMYELRASSGEQPVFLAEGQTMEMQHLSPEGGTYDFWYLNEQTGNWENQGIAEEVQNVPSSVPADIEQEIDRLEQEVARVPEAPQSDKDNQLILGQDIELKGCPELAGKNPLVVTYAGTDEAKAPKNNQWITQADIWRKKVLSKTNREGVYQLTMMGERVYQIEVREALTGLALEKAEAAYEEALAKYNATKRMLTKKRQLAERQQQFLRSARLAGFGIYNYDRLLKRQDMIPLLADFEFDNMPRSLKDQLTVFYISGDKGRSVIKLTPNSWRHFRYRPNTRNCLVAVLPNNQVAVFSNADFEREKETMRAAAGQPFLFELKKQSTRVKSPEDLAKIIDQAG